MEGSANDAIKISVGDVLFDQNGSGLGEVECSIGAKSIPIFLLKVGDKSDGWKQWGIK
jgi:hypothetical protein